MSGQEKFSAIRKGLLEFLILKIIASDKVYVADMLSRLSETEFKTNHPHCSSGDIDLSSTGKALRGN